MLCNILSITGPCFQLVHRISTQNYGDDNYLGNRSRAHFRSQAIKTQIDTKLGRKKTLISFVLKQAFLTKLKET